MRWKMAKRECCGVCLSSRIGRGMVTAIAAAACVVGSLDVAKGQFFEPDAVVEGRSVVEWVEEWNNWTTRLDTTIATSPTNVDPFDFFANNPGPLDDYYDPFFVSVDDLELSNNDRNVFFVPSLPVPPDAMNYSIAFNVPANRPILSMIRSIGYFRTPEEVDVNGVPVFISGEPVDAIEPPDPDAIFNFVQDIGDEELPLTRFVFEGDEQPTDSLLEHRYTEFFTAEIPEGYPFDAEGTWPQSVFDGIWYMLEPLERGEQYTYTIEFIDPALGFDPLGATRFTLTAVPEPASWMLLVVGGISCFAYTHHRRRAA